MDGSAVSDPLSFTLFSYFFSLVGRFVLLLLLFHPMPLRVKLLLGRLLGFAGRICALGRVVGASRQSYLAANLVW